MGVTFDFHVKLLCNNNNNISRIPAPFKRKLKRESTHNFRLF